MDGNEVRNWNAGQAQRAAERGADVDVTAAEQALVLAQGELEAATRARDSLLASTSQVTMQPILFMITTISICITPCRCLCTHTSQPLCSL